MSTDGPTAIERCAYCREYVPVTTVEIHAPIYERGLSAQVPVCTDCLNDGR